MIVYRELSSLTSSLGFSASALYYATNHTAAHYHSVSVSKQICNTRILSVPDEFLKSIQRAIVNTILCHEPVSPYAMAYRYGGSVAKNAAPHVGAPVILKLDIRHFFDKIIYPFVKSKAFPENKYSHSNSVLLTLLCTHNGVLPQGAPTSPVISNIVMRDFDNTVGAWCSQQGIRYTRYCDDMTFSGNFDCKEVKRFIKNELGRLGFFLNNNKTRVLRDGQQKIVTGVVVNEKLGVSSKYKKSIRSDIYYCTKFGVQAHIAHNSLQTDPLAFLQSLLGKISHVLTIEPHNAEMQRYKAFCRDQINLLKNTTTKSI